MRVLHENNIKKDVRPLEEVSDQNGPTSLPSQKKFDCSIICSMMTNLIIWDTLSLL